MNIKTKVQKAIEAQADLRETMEVKQIKDENLRLRTKINSLKMEQIHTEALRVVGEACFKSADDRNIGTIGHVNLDKSNLAVAIKDMPMVTIEQQLRLRAKAMIMEAAVRKYQADKTTGSMIAMFDLVGL
tara:strand:- start:186 stop:575 length:390 start_codon:yes stop_codon:yes gene_type:complete